MSLTADRPRPQIPPAALHSVAWVAGENLSYEEWLRQGSRLGLAGRNASWWVGDWLRYGTHRYGKKYTAATQVTGYDRQTLMNMVYVATRFDISRRRENLSWSHHAELAPLDQDEQDHWLDRAAAEKLSVRDLREELSSVKKAPAPARNRSQSASAGDVHQSVVCPECGHTFTFTAPTRSSGAPAD
jgi:hypothetical protein